MAPRLFFPLHVWFRATVSRTNTRENQTSFGGDWWKSKTEPSKIILWLKYFLTVVLLHCFFFFSFLFFCSDRFSCPVQFSENNRYFFFNYLFIYPFRFIHYLFTYWFIVYSFIYSFIHSFIHSLIYLFVYLFVYLFTAFCTTSAFLKIIKRIVPDHSDD